MFYLIRDILNVPVETMYFLTLIYFSPNLSIFINCFIFSESIFSRDIKSGISLSDFLVHDCSVPYHDPYYIICFSYQALEILCGPRYFISVT